jgi:hypothetical protein
MEKHFQMFFGNWLHGWWLWQVSYMILG